MMRTTYEAIQELLVHMEQKLDPRGRLVSENPHFEVGETR
jgi:hypothetical protein